MTTSYPGLPIALQYVADGYSAIEAAEKTGVPLFTLRQAIEEYADRPVTPAEEVSQHVSHHDTAPDQRVRPESDSGDRSDSRRRTWWNLGDLLAAEFPEPRWAVPELIPEGVTLLAGQPKVGKSWLSLGLGVAVASGGKALGEIEVEPGGVLYCALEDTPRRLQDRLGRVLGGQHPSREAQRNLEIVTEWDTERVDRWLSETRGKRLLILDVLARVRGPVPPGAQVYDADYRAMSRIKAIADEYEVPCIAVHHTRKMASSDFLNEVSGSNGLAGASDAVIVLKRMRGEADAELHITGRDVMESEWALNFDASLGAWIKLDRPAAEYKLSDTRASILAYLREHGSGSPKQVADALDITPASARQTLRRMADDGQLDTDGRGTYIPVTPVTPVISAGQRRDSGQTGLSLIEGEPEDHTYV